MPANRGDPASYTSCMTFSISQREENRNRQKPPGSPMIPPENQNRSCTIGRKLNVPRSLNERARMSGAIAAFCALLASMGLSQAQTKYPEKPVRIIVPYGAGGVADVTTRLVALKVRAEMG